MLNSDLGKRRDVNRDPIILSLLIALCLCIYFSIRFSLFLCFLNPNFPPIPSSFLLILSTLHQRLYPMRSRSGALYILNSCCHNHPFMHMILLFGLTSLLHAPTYPLPHVCGRSWVFNGFSRVVRNRGGVYLFHLLMS